MTEQQEAATGTNVEPTQDANESNESASTQQNESQENANDSSTNKWVQKLLSQRNEARTQAEQLAKENEELKAMISGQVNQELDLRKRKEELNNFKASVDEEVAQDVENYLNLNPNSTVQQAFNATHPDKALKQGQAFWMWGQVPNKMKTEPKANEMSDDELREAAMKDLQAMWVRGRF